MLAERCFSRQMENFGIWTQGRNALCFPVSEIRQP